MKSCFRFLSFSLCYCLGPQTFTNTQQHKSSSEAASEAVSHKGCSNTTYTSLQCCLTSLVSDGPAVARRQLTSLLFQALANSPASLDPYQWCPCMSRKQPERMKSTYPIPCETIIKRRDRGKGFSDNANTVL